MRIIKDYLISHKGIKRENNEDNIYDFDSDNPLDMNTYVELVNKTKNLDILYLN